MKARLRGVRNWFMVARISICFLDRCRRRFSCSGTVSWSSVAAGSQASFSAASSGSAASKSSFCSSAACTVVKAVRGRERVRRDLELGGEGAERVAARRLGGRGVELGGAVVGHVGRGAVGRGRGRGGVGRGQVQVVRVAHLVLAHRLRVVEAAVDAHDAQAAVVVEGVAGERGVGERSRALAQRMDGLEHVEVVEDEVGWAGAPVALHAEQHDVGAHLAHAGGLHEALGALAQRGRHHGAVEGLDGALGQPGVDLLAELVHLGEHLLRRRLLRANGEWLGERESRKAAPTSTT